MNALQPPTLPEEQKEVKTRAEKTASEETPPQKPAAWVPDLDFWRFVLAALSLAWEIAKTWVH